MKINTKDLKILECSMPNAFGYMEDDRVLELMKLGYIKNNPRKKWSINGYKATEKGIELYNNWMKEIGESHGHDWETYEDYQKREGWHDEGDTYDEDEKTKPYSMAYSEGYHNGYRCKKCGFEYCHHCYTENEIEKCDEKSINKMVDDSKLDSTFVAMDNSIRQSYGLAPIKNSSDKNSKVNKQ